MFLAVNHISYTFTLFLRESQWELIGLLTGSFLGYKIRVYFSHTVWSACCLHYAGNLLGLLLNPEVGANVFLQNVG
jgi:hypothetical protein